MVVVWREAERAGTFRLYWQEELVKVEVVEARLTEA